ncbi:hypothetical protein N7G274_006968 [Stereocaulon virgatum]|uniref:RING-type domain-containing protein n=1 Tax=Stereocaulon virgatum TaxID=373712 RepID=A0ABR4A4S0_9LECA
MSTPSESQAALTPTFLMGDSHHNSAMTSSPTRSIHVRTDKDGPAALLQTLETSMDDIRTLMTCRVCVRPLFEPYTIECGHTFCYGCLVKWFERDRTKKSCPDCRADVPRAPAPAYLVRDMTQIFANRPELMPPGETTEEYKKWQAEEAAVVEKDRLRKGSKGGLFRGCFRRRSIMRAAPIRDDGIDRCPRCTWELEDGQCESCGYLDGGAQLSESGSPGYYPDELYHVDRIDDMDDEILDALAEEAYARGHGPVYGEDLDSNHSQSIGDYYSPPPDRRPFGYRVLGPDHPRLNFNSLPNTDEDSIDDDGTNSLDDFIEDDENGPISVTSSVRDVHWDTDDRTDSESIQSQASDGDGNSQDGTHPYQDEASSRTVQYNPDEDSDEEPVSPLRRQPRRMSIASDDPSSSEVSQVMAAILDQRQRSSTSGTGRSISRHRYKIPHHSRDMGPRIIEIESDSDSPIPSQRQRKRRPIQNCLSPDDESGEETSSATAIVDRLSPRPEPLTQKIKRPQTSQNSNASSPVLVESSPARPAISENINRAVPDSFSPSMPFHERSQSAVPTTSLDRSSGPYGSPSQAPAPANHGAHSSPRASSTLDRLLAVESRQRPGSHLESRSQSRLTRHSPATRLSCSPTSAEQRYEAGVVNRRAEKLERREERRRLKAQRNRERRQA